MSSSWDWQPHEAPGLRGTFVGNMDTSPLWLFPMGPDDKPLSKKLCGAQELCQEDGILQACFHQDARSERLFTFLGWWEAGGNLMRRGGAPTWVLLAQEDHPEKQLCWWPPNPTRGRNRSRAQRTAERRRVTRSRAELPGIWGPVELAS